MSDDLFKERDFDGFRFSDSARKYCADKANAIASDFLAKGTVVYSHGPIIKMPNTNWQAMKYEYSTHAGVLINIKPIEPEDSERKVLEDFIACCEVGDPKLRFGELVERARKLLVRIGS